MIVAQITDLHIVEKDERLWGEWDSAEGLRRAVVRLNELEPQPDYLMITGDLVDTGTPSSYAHLTELLAELTMPIGVIPGNHDSRDGMQNLTFGHAFDPSVAPYCQFATALGPLRLVALDTLDEGKPSGALCDARLDWFEATLAEDTITPTIVAMHHPPFKSGITFMDGIGLTVGSERFVACVERAPNIVRIICGHQHRPITTTIAGAMVSLCSSTTVQLPFDLGPDMPLPLVAEPPTLQLHLWHEDHLVSHTLYIDRY
jgi:3',5'-cyclic AMP phosphodiesterase CpdA